MNSSKAIKLLVLTVLFLASVALVYADSYQTYTATPSQDPVYTGGEYATIISVSLGTGTKTNLFSSVPAYKYEAALVQLASSVRLIFNGTLGANVATSGWFIDGPGTFTFGIEKLKPENTGLCGTVVTTPSVIKVLPLKHMPGVPYN